MLSTSLWSHCYCVILRSFFVIKKLIMSKPIKSSARELLFNMMNKYKGKQKEKESLFKQKTECLDIVVKFIKDLDLDSEAKQEVLENLSKLKELEQKDHVLHVEDQYRTRDGIAEDMEQFIISVRDEESVSSDESDMGVEYLEFDYSE